jgi:hypothetical protein
MSDEKLQNIIRSRPSRQRYSSASFIKHYTLRKYTSTTKTTALDGSKRLTSCRCFFITGKTAHDTHCTGGWVILRAGLDAVEKVKKIKISCPLRESHPTLLPNVTNNDYIGIPT